MLFLQMLTAQQHLFEANGAHRYQVFFTGAETHGLFWRPEEANEPGKERRESALSYNICPLSVNHGTIFPLGMCPIFPQAFFTEEERSHRTNSSR